MSKGAVQKIRDGKFEIFDPLIHPINECKYDSLALRNAGVIDTPSNTYTYVLILKNKN